MSDEAEHFDTVIDARFHAVNVRFNAMDEANKVLSATVTRVPTDLQTAIAGLTNLMDEKFKGLDGKMGVAIEALKDAAKERRQSDLEQAKQRDESTTHAIDAQGKLLTETKDGLSAKIYSLESRLAASEAALTGARGSRDDARSNIGMYVGIGGFVVGVGIALVGIVTAINHNSTSIASAPREAVLMAPVQSSGAVKP